MNTPHMPLKPFVSDDLAVIGDTIADHLYTAKCAPGGQKPVSHERPLNRARLAEILHTTYAVLAQVLAGRQRLSDNQWRILMRGGNQAQDKPVLPFDRDEIERLNSCWARVQASRTGYKAEPLRKVGERWLGWIEEGDELSLTLLKAEVIEKLKHLRQPYL